MLIQMYTNRCCSKGQNKAVPVNEFRNGCIAWTGLETCVDRSEDKPRV